MDDDFTAPAEAVLIEQARLALPKKQRAVARVAKLAGISEGWWRQIAKGYQQATKETRLRAHAPSDTLARMAKAVGVTPDQLREAGRHDAAAELLAIADFIQDQERIVRRPAAPHVPNPHDEYFGRAERLLRHSHESLLAGDDIGAIHGLEGVWSTVELLVDRITDEALLKGIDDAHKSNPPTNQAPSSGASGEAGEGKKTELSDDSQLELSAPGLGDFVGEVGGALGVPEVDDTDHAGEEGA